VASEAQYAPDRFERSVAAIEALLDEIGIGRRELFHDVGEGSIFPDGTESMSGHVVDQLGRVFIFWTDWDAARKRPVFTTWKQLKPEPSLLASKEYQRARAALGLTRTRSAPPDGPAESDDRSG
jgi:hypothetical protein